MKNFFGDKLNISKTEENANSRKIKPLKHIELVNKQPIDKQSTDQPTTSAQSDNTFMAILRKGAEKMLAYPQQVIAMANRRPEIQEEYRQVCIVLNACKNRYRELDSQKKSHVPFTEDQEKFLEAFKQAYEYKNKAKGILDQLAMDPDELERFMKDLKQANQDLNSNKLVQEAVFPASVKIDSSGKITIDLAKFVPSAIDLSKLDLSDQNHIEIDLSHINENKYNYPLSNIHSLSLDNRTLNSALKLGYSCKLYNTHPDLYRQTLEHYLKTRLYLKLRKADLPADAFKKFTNLSGDYAEKLVSIVISTKSELGESIRHDHHYSSNNNSEIRKDYQDDPKTQRKKNELKALFSDDTTAKNIAEEKCILNAYQAIIPPDLKAPTEQRDDLETLNQINHSLREIAQNYPEQFRPALKQAIVTTRTLHHWAANFQDRFDLNEEWIQNGMKELGITKENFETSFTEFQTNPLLTHQEILSGLAVSDIVYGNPDTRHPAYNAHLIVQHFEDFTRLNAKLKAIHDLLKEGIPVKDIPERIRGLERIPTSGSKLNCLIHALLKVDKPERDMNEIVQEAPSIRENLAKEMEKKLDEYTRDQKRAADEGVDTLIFSEGYNAVKSNHMLSLGAFDGKELINFLREHNLIDPDRNLVVYELSRQGKIRCMDHYPVNSSTKPYSLFLQEDYHFDALIEPQKK